MAPGPINVENGENGKAASKDPAYEDMSFLVRISSRVHKGISDFFEWEGRFVYRRPFTIIATTGLFAVLCTILFFTLFSEELDGDKLFTPENSRAFDDQEYVEALYGEPDVTTRVLITRNVDLEKETVCSNRDLLVDPETAKSFLFEVFDLYDRIEAIRVEEDGETLGLDDVCVKPTDGPCQVESILDAWNYSRAILTDDPDVTATLARDDLTTRFGRPLDKNLVMGRNRDGGDCNGNVEVYQFQFVLKWEREDVNGADIDPETRKWLEELVDVVRDDWETIRLEGFVSDFNAIDSESEKAVNRDITKLSLGYALILLYSHVVLWKNSRVFNKSHLAMLSAVSVAMAIFTSFGLAQVFQVKFNLVVQTLPFLLLGLGMDDTFVILGAYHNTDINLPGEERVAQAMKRAGSSILVTSLTDFAAFAMGTYTELPALRGFAVHAFLGILFDFFYQVTFFVAFLALDVKREKRAMNGAPYAGFRCCCGTSEYDEGEYSGTVASGIGNDVEQGALSTPNGDAAAKNASWKRKTFGKGEYDPTMPSISTRLVGDWLPNLTLHPVGKTIVILLETALLVAAIYGSTKVKMDFQFRDWFTPDGSWLKDAFEVEDRYFVGDSTRFSIYTKEAPAEQPSYFFFQDNFVRLVDDLRANDKFVSDVPPVQSWFEDFSRWLTVPGTPHFNETPTSDTFDAWVNEFVNSPDGAFYKSRIVFDDKEPFSIISSEIDGWSQDVKDGQYAVDFVDSLRETAEAAIPDLDPIAFDQIFLFYDGFRVIDWETIRNVILAGVAVFVMSLVVLADFFGALMVLGMVAATDIMLFGWMHYVDLTFNTVTAINMVLAVGIAVDYSAHIAHSFLVVKGTRDERARSALFHIGGEVASGAFTTFLAIVVMAAAEHYIFEVFFKMFAAIVMFGLWHGIVVLPVLLSLIGPSAYA